MPFMRFIFIFISILTTACQHQSVETVSLQQPDQKIQLIPRQAVFGNPQRIQARISPDGQWISWLAPKQGVMNIWVAPTDDTLNSHSITDTTGHGIPRHFWSTDSSHILYLKDNNGDENNHVYAVNILTEETRDLTPLKKGAKAVIQGTDRSRPGVVLVGINERDSRYFDLYEIDISTGKRQLVMQNPGFASWIVDNALHPRFAVKQQPGGKSIILRQDKNNEWKLFTTIPAEDSLTTQFISFDKKNESIYVLDSRLKDKSALVRMNAENGKTELLAKGDRADINDLLIDPVSYEVLAYAENYKRINWKPLNDRMVEEFNFLQQHISGDMQFLSVTDDANRVIIYADSPDQPGVYYLYDRKNQTVSKLFNTRPQLSAFKLQGMKAIEIPSRDGLKLVSYLTLPEGSDRDHNGIPDTKLPMVLYVHGGPWARDEYGFNSVHQWLANRGYAVLSVNYRGSTGFGKSFLNAAVGEFAGKMHNDLIDAVDWAIDQQIADPEKVAIMGGSYGGYATLVGISFTPDTFACGVDIVGVSSLVTVIESFPDYWKPFLEGTWYKFVGDPSNPQERADMLARSPISRIDAIKVPLLIGQGENDPRVTKQESDQLVEAMSQKGLPVTYINYPDEGHGFSRPENRISFFAITEAFLSQCLQGRHEPVNNDFEGSSLQVLHGIEYTPGLQQAAEQSN